MSDVLERLELWIKEKGYLRGNLTGELLRDAIDEIERLRGMVYEYPPTELSPDGVTWKQEAERLRKDNAVLADEVRANRLVEQLFLNGEDDPVTIRYGYAVEDMHIAKNNTDASGALERAGGA